MSKQRIYELEVAVRRAERLMEAVETYVPDVSIEIIDVWNSFREALAKELGDVDKA